MPKSPENRSFIPLYRSETNKILGGVCGGLGDYFDLDPNIIRVIFILLTVFGGSGLLIYLILWIILPSKSQTTLNGDHVRQNINEVKDKVHQFAHDLKFSSKRATDSNHTSQRSWLAIVVILLGLIFLFNNFGFGSLIDLGRLWPLILVALGVSIILKDERS